MDPLQEYELELQVEGKANQMVSYLMDKYADISETQNIYPKITTRFGDGEESIFFVVDINGNEK